MTTPATSRIGRSGLARIGEVIGSEAVAFGSYIALTMILHPSMIGIVALASGSILVLQILMNNGLSDALIQKETITTIHYRTAAAANLVIASSIIALLYITAPLFEQTLHEDGLAEVMRWLVPTLIPYAVSRVTLAKLRRDIRGKTIAITSVASVMLGATTAIGLALSGAGVWSLVAQQWVYALTCLGCSWYFSRVSLLGRCSWQSLLELASFGFYSTFQAILTECTKRLDIFAVAAFSDATTVGYYALASRLIFAVNMLTSYSIESFMLPVLSRVAQSDRERLPGNVYTVMRWTTMFCAPVFIGTGLIANPLIQLAYGDGWFSAILALQFMGMVGMFYGFNLIAGKILLADGHKRDALWLSLFSAALFMGAVFGAARFDFIAIILAGGVANLISYTIYVWVLCKRFSLSGTAYVDLQLLPWGATVAMTVACLLLQQQLEGFPYAVVLVATIVMGAVTFGLVLWLFAKNDVKTIYASLRPASAG